MKERSYRYNAGGFAIDEKGGFVSLKKESTETLKHRRKLLWADLWRNRKVRPEEIAGGYRPAEQSQEVEKAMKKTIKGLIKVNAELKTR